MDKGTGRRRIYRPFSEFRLHSDSPNADTGTFQARTEPRPGGKQASYLTVTHFGPADGFQEEYLSVSIRATNGPLPRQELQEGSICNPSSDFPNFSDFANFTRPSSPLAAPDAAHYLWHVLAHLNMNYRSLCQEGVLKEILSLYDWSRRSANRKLVEGLLKARAEKKRFLVGSQLLSGTEIVVEFREDSFPSTGERLLFARVLLRFLSQYTSINHLVSLKMRVLPSGLELHLDPIEGKSHPI
jgi:type VI secretion system protein ImpG